jgi:hypothetical protein
MTRCRRLQRLHQCALTRPRKSGSPSDRSKLGDSAVGHSTMLAVAIVPEFESSSESELGHDSSTNVLIRRNRTLKG